MPIVWYEPGGEYWTTTFCIGVVDTQGLLVKERHFESHVLSDVWVESVDHGTKLCLFGFGPAKKVVEQQTKCSRGLPTTIGDRNPPRLVLMFQSPQYVPRSLAANHLVSSMAHAGAPMPCTPPAAPACIDAQQSTINWCGHRYAGRTYVCCSYMRSPSSLQRRRNSAHHPHLQRHFNRTPTHLQSAVHGPQCCPPEHAAGEAESDVDDAGGHQAHCQHQARGEGRTQHAAQELAQA